MVLIGILISFATLNVGDGGADKKLRQEAERLASLMQLASEESVISGDELALMLTHNGFAFYRLFDDGWQLLIEDRVLHPRFLSTDFQYELSFEGLQVDLDTAEETEYFELDPENEEKKPQVYILSSGELGAFDIAVSSPVLDYAYHITPGLIGELAIERIEEDL